MNISRLLPREIPADIIRRLTNDSFFASKEFAALWAVKGGRQVYWTAEEQGTILAVLPGIEVGRGIFTRFMAMPDGCYGSLYFDDKVAADHSLIAQQLLDALVKQRYIKLSLYDFYHALPDDSRFTRQPCETTLVDISDPEWLPPNKRLQAQIRQAIKQGIETTPFDWPTHHVAFLQLMELAERKHGRKPKYSKDFFKALAELAKNDHRVQWVWCEHDGQPACSHIYLIERRILLSWQIYFDRKFSFLRPDQYIRFMMCRRLARQGLVDKLNLGATPPDAEGLAFYKRRWGGKIVQYNCYMLKKGLGRLL